MNILLDTHVLIWALENNPTLSDGAREAIVDGHNMVFISAATIWEISIKSSTGKLQTPGNLLEEIKLHRFTPLPIQFEHAQRAGQLPLRHKDPFDRILIAQALHEQLTLVTRDEIIPQYDDIKTLLA